MEMIVADSNYSMASSMASYKSSVSSESLRVWVDAPQATQAAQMSPPAASSAASIVDFFNQTQDDPILEMLRAIIEELSGHKINKIQIAPPQLSQPPANVNQPAQAAPAPAKAGWGVQYQKSDSYSESQQTAFAASGAIRTTDGKEIDFSVNLNMDYQYSTSSQTNINLGDSKKTDPLVVNFGGTSAQLSDQRFSFDLSQGRPSENINFTTGGSGFLVLDKNGNGKIDSGGEMFGPTTGNGFAELSAYDKTGKGWIDSGNPIFDKLKVWTKNQDGTDNLASLASLGIGAISVNGISTPFDMKAADNSLKGAVKSTGVFLREDGSAGTVQQVDLTA
jgi:hypothetical protein